jgi:hypothetical protein
MSKEQWGIRLSFDACRHTAMFGPNPHAEFYSYCCTYSPSN